MNIMDFYGQKLNDVDFRRYLIITLRYPNIEKEVDEYIKLHTCIYDKEQENAEKRFVFGMLVIEDVIIKSRGEILKIVNRVEGNGCMDEQDVRRLYTIGIYLIIELCDATRSINVESFFNKLRKGEVKLNHFKEAISKKWRNFYYAI